MPGCINISGAGKSLAAVGSGFIEIEFAVGGEGDAAEAPWDARAGSGCAKSAVDIAEEKESGGGGVAPTGGADDADTCLAVEGDEVLAGVIGDSVSLVLSPALEKHKASGTAFCRGGEESAVEEFEVNVAAGLAEDAELVDHHLGVGLVTGEGTQQQNREKGDKKRWGYWSQSHALTVGQSLIDVEGVNGVRMGRCGVRSAVAYRRYAQGAAVSGRRAFPLSAGEGLAGRISLPGPGSSSPTGARGKRYKILGVACDFWAWEAI